MCRANFNDKLFFWPRSLIYDVEGWSNTYLEKK